MKKIIAALIASIGFSANAAIVDPASFVANQAGCLAFGSDSVTATFMGTEYCSAGNTFEVSQAGTGVFSFSNNATAANNAFAMIYNNSFSSFQSISNLLAGNNTLTATSTGADSLYVYLVSNGGSVTFSNLDWTFSPLAGGGAGAGADVSLPGTLVLMGLGMAGIGIRRLRAE